MPLNSEQQLLDHVVGVIAVEDVAGWIGVPIADWQECRRRYAAAQSACLQDGFPT
jgi:hypothetical protein